jgi:hypothetical protein
MRHLAPAIVACALLAAASARAESAGSITLQCGHTYEVIGTVHAEQTERARIVWFDSAGAAQGSQEFSARGEGPLGTGRNAGRQRIALPGPDDQRCRVEFSLLAGDPPQPARDFRIRERSTDTCIYAEDGNDQDYDDIVLCFYPAASGGEQLDRPAPPPPP